MSDTDIIFYLVAENDLAQRVIDDEVNSSYRVEWDGVGVLQVGLGRTSKKPGSLISFGRDQTRSDVVFPTKQWSSLHCHFFLNKSSLALILRDTSMTNSTEVMYIDKADDRTYKLQGTPRQRVLLRGEAIIVSMGRAHFQISWPEHQSSVENENFEQAKALFAQREMPSGLDWTDLDFRVLPETAYETRSAHTPHVATQYEKLPTIVHELSAFLGAGTFGTVHRTLDLDNGNLLAVKRSTRPSDQEHYKPEWKREVEILARLSHANIVKFVHSQGWNIGAPVEIFMSLHEGTLKSLMSRHRCDQSPGPAPLYTDALFMQVVLALHYLHGEGIIHKDVKPDNILYDHKGTDNQLAFYLTDFGLSKEQDLESAGDCVEGSIPYMAPEVYQSQPHTGKSDMWSLGVMMLEVLGYFCIQEIDLEPREWRNRMALLPNFQPNFSFELYQGPPISNTSWPNHLRWYGRLLALPKNKMIIHDCLIPLLKDNAKDRFDTRRVIARFPSENPVRRYNLRNLAVRQEFRL